MSDDERTAAVRRFFQDVWNEANVAEAGNFLAEKFVSHNSFDVAIIGPEQYGEAVLAYRSAFPDLVTTIEDAFATDDRVVVRGTDRGTHRGTFMGYPASGRVVTATFIEIFRLEDGKAVEGWVETDLKRFIDQITATPAE